MMSDIKVDHSAPKFLPKRPNGEYVVAIRKDGEIHDIFTSPTQLPKGAMTMGEIDRLKAGEHPYVKGTEPVRVHGDKRLNGTTYVCIDEQGQYLAPEALQVRWQEDITDAAILSEGEKDFFAPRMKKGEWEVYSQLEIDFVGMREEANGDWVAAEYEDEIENHAVTVKVTYPHTLEPHDLVEEHEAFTREAIDDIIETLIEAYPCLDFPEPTWVDGSRPAPG